MSTTLQGPQSGVTRATRMSIAVIGPDKKRRAVVAKALANSEDRTVQEFAAYPEDLSDLPRMVGQNFDVVMIDLDSDEDYALAIVANLATISNATVMVYSTRNDPTLLMNSKRAGARDFLPIPAEAVGETPQPAPPLVEEPKPGPEAVAQSQELDEVRSAILKDPEGTTEKAAPTSNGTAPSNAQRAGIPQGERASSEFKQWERGPARDALPASQRAAEVRMRAGIVPAPSTRRDPEPVVVKEPDFNTPVEVPPARQTGATPVDVAPARPAGGIETDADVLALFREVQAKEVIAPDPDEEPSFNWKKWALISAGPVALTILFWLVFSHPARKTASVPEPATATIPQEAETPVEAATTTPKVATPTQPPPKSWATLTDAPVAAPVASAAPQPQPVASEMMDAQLAAPSRISKDVKAAPVEDAPGSLSAGAIDDGGSVQGAVFSGGSKMKVVAPSAISAGVAEGMLIHKTEPVYPKFARDNHIGGTVVLKAKIAKNGTLQDLQVISGPKILGTAAMDAARNWRYKPYMLNNQPVEVDTSISVVFSIGK
jgi:protein TonB